MSVVAIGASAGGLGAAAHVLSELGSDLPAAVVVVLHLMPEHRSHLAAILGRATTLPVVEAEDGVLLEEGHVYVAPPDAHTLARADGRLALETSAPVRYLRPSIDRFFASLADAFDGRAVAVVLSGSGADGAEGVGLVKAAGGTVLVQSPDSSEYPSMPAAAVATGCVDQALPLDELAAAVVEAVTVPA